VLIFDFSRTLYRVYHSASAVHDEPCRIRDGKEPQAAQRTAATRRGHVSAAMATSSAATASLHLLLPASRRRRLLVPRATADSTTPPVDRRRFITHTAAAAAAVAPLVLPRWTPAARADDAPALSEWERVLLPIDPGVVLLDIAFVPDDPSHGT
jgi:hypothetical protein